jgi:beta-barrel assembly-enhancing protease
MELANFNRIVVVISALLLSATSSAQRLSSSNRSALLPKQLKQIQKYDLASASKRKVGKGFNLLSAADEQQMGGDEAEDIEAQCKLINDDRLLAYLQKVGENLVERSDARNRQFVFKIIQDDSVNALSLPNGVIYVDSGLFLELESEAELAGVLSHEIAHVAAHHAARSATRRGFMGVANLSMAMLTGGVGQAIQPAGGIAEKLMLLKFGRENEFEADILGIEYMYLAGYDPQAFERWLQRMDQGSTERKRRFSGLLMTHPATADRITLAKYMTTTMLPPRESVDDTSSFQEAKAKVLELTHPVESMQLNRKPVLLRRTTEGENR